MGRDAVAPYVIGLIEINGARATPVTFLIELIVKKGEYHGEEK